MKRVGHLFETVCAFDNLIRAAGKAMKGHRKKAAVDRFFLNLETEVMLLRRELLSGAYRPLPYNSFTVYEPKRRHICAAHLRDRVVHHAICGPLEPLMEKWFIGDTYACREDKGTHRAVRRAQAFSRKRAFFFKSDVKTFFATIDHETLKEVLRRKIKDARLLKLMDTIIDHPVPGHPPGKGLAIGNLTSQWWANLYLDVLDHFVKDHLGVRCYVRYMDDFLLMENDKASLHLLRSEVESFLRERLRLRLKESATYVAPVRQGIPFLGFRIFPKLIRLNHRGRVRFIRKLRQREQQFSDGEIDESAFIHSVGSLLGHVRQGDTHRWRQRLFHDLG